MKYLFQFIFIFISISSIGQENELSNNILCAPVFISNEKMETGSGVFFNDSINIYLITAGHVLYDTAKNKPTLKCKLINLLFYPDNIVNGNSNVISIDFKKMKDSLVRYNSEHDIAVIKIAHIEKIDSKIDQIVVSFLPHITSDLNFNKINNLNQIGLQDIRKYHDVSIGSEIYIFGYPTSIGLKQSPQFDYFRPLLRSGVVAGKYENKKTIIIDSPVYFGNSGGPVFEVVWHGFSRNIKLIGIVSEYVPFYDEMISRQTGAQNIQVMNSGYSIITPIEYALDLMKKIK